MILLQALKKTFSQMLSRMPWVSTHDTSDISDNCSTISRWPRKHIFLRIGFRGESGPSSLDSHQLEREIARERRISGGGNFDVASSVKERRVSGSVQGGLRERRVSGDVVEGGNVDDGKNVEVSGRGKCHHHHHHLVTSLKVGERDGCPEKVC